MSSKYVCLLCNVPGVFFFGCDCLLDGLSKCVARHISLDVFAHLLTRPICSAISDLFLPENNSALGVDKAFFVFRSFS